MPVGPILNALRIQCKQTLYVTLELHQILLVDILFLSILVVLARVNRVNCNSFHVRQNIVHGCLKKRLVGCLVRVPQKLNHTQPYPHCIQLNMNFMFVCLQNVPNDCNGNLDGLPRLMMGITCCLLRSLVGSAWSSDMLRETYR